MLFTTKNVLSENLQFVFFWWTFYDVAGTVFTIGFGLDGMSVKLSIQLFYVINFVRPGWSHRKFCPVPAVSYRKFCPVPTVSHREFCPVLTVTHNTFCFQFGLFHVVNFPLEYP